MIEALKSISDFLLMVVQFIANLIAGVFALLQMIPTAVSFLTMAIASLPPEIAVIGTALITLSIVFLIVGR